MCARLASFERDSKLVPGNRGKIWITANEAASILDTTPDRINYFGKMGKLPRCKMGSNFQQWRYNKRYIENVVIHWWKKYQIK